MKAKTRKQNRAPRLNRNRSNISDALRTARRHSAYAFVAGLGIWLPKANAATLVNLDATALPLGETNSWSNTGTVVGDFTTPLGATTNPVVVLVDGVKGMFFESGGGGGGGAGSHFSGPTAPTSVCSTNARTVEAWIYNSLSEGEHMVFAWGRRGADGLNNAFGHGTDLAFGAVGMWGEPDIGWGNNGAQMATNRVVNRWTYIVQSFDGATNSVYVDGRLANTEGPPATAIINTAELADDNLTPLPFRVARQSAAAGGPSGVGDLNIVISRVRVHDVAMNSGSISNQFFVEKGDFNLNDTDGDQMPDWWEERYGLNKNSNADAATDADSDTLSNLAEYQNNTNPLDTDTDDDGVTDGSEVNRTDPQTTLAAPTNPTDPDSDDDGLSDGVETDNGTYTSPTNTGTDPLKGDTDGDIASDGSEIACGANPVNALSTCGLVRAVELDATGLATGLLTNWINTGYVPGNFVSTNANTPAVVTADGVNAVAFLAVGNGDTGTHYVGPVAPPEFTGATPHSIEAWVLNLSPQAEETVFGWGRRGGPDGTTVGFNHSTSGQFGAVTHWGAGPDVGWAGSTNLSFSRWNHVAYTYDGTNSRVYADGVLANSEVTGALNVFGSDTAAGSLVFRAARQNDGDGGPSDTGVGQITVAKIRVYTNVLDGATIKARFDSEKTAFNLIDSDSDGLPDWWEIRYGLNKNDATGNNGAAGNPDADGLTNIREFQNGTNPIDSDSDDDGRTDGQEVDRFDIVGGVVTTNAAPTNPLNPDSDADNLTDGAETDTGIFVNAGNTGTDPLKVDTDNDTYADGLEVAQGSNPVNAGSIPSSDPIINLVATNLTLGTLVNWTNSGTFSNGVPFVCTNATVPNVQVVQGVKAVRLPGPVTTGPFYTGPNTAGSQVTGNPTYSVEAWILNESPQVTEETIFAWGRRTGTGVNAAFGHGISGAFGAMGHFGAPDLGWGSNALASAQNVIMDRWTHVVYTYNANTLQQQAYVDGVRVNFEQLGAALQIATTNSTGGPLQFRVGSQNNNGGTPTADFRGNGLSIAELRVYTLTLSASDILTRFNNGVNAYGITDTDGDNIPSWYERTYPTCLNESVGTDGGNDCDGDGLTNQAEYSNGTSPIDSDSDDDGVSDGDEVNVYGSNPRNPDTDQDGLPDGREVAFGSAPLGLGSTDTDSDGYFDSLEVVYGSDPTNSVSMPNTNNAVPFVVLDATDLPLGSLPNWTNRNALGWNFVGGLNATGAVQFVEGTKGVGFFTTNHYQGPRIPFFFGGGTHRTVEAWIYNTAAAGEETVFAWGRRGGAPDGSNSSFQHGTDAAFGAMGLWGGGPDVPWGTNAAHIASNVITGRWTHVAYTYGIEDVTNGVRTAYRDGVVANREVSTNLALINTHTYDPLDPLNVAPNFFGKTLPFRVGGQSAADGTFDAGAARPTLTIGRVKAYNQALTAAQIAAHYNAERVQFPGQPRITNVRVNPNGTVSFDWVPAAGRTYEVQRNESVTNAGDWSVIATGQNSGSFTDNPVTSPKFYRLRLEPLP